MPLTVAQFTERLTASGLMSADEVSVFLQALLPDAPSHSDGEALARELVKQKKLTKFQAEQLFAGKGKSLTLGNYVILDKLGQGGMGMVLKAEHRRMKRLVALKVMSPAAVKTPDSLKRFHREVEAAAKLRHPNIVAADDADEAKGTHFLVMEFVDGSDLSALVKKHGPLPAEQAIRCIVQAARGLEYAHEQGVIHRDIKPANLLIDAKGTVKILDMGLARIDGAIGGSSEGAGLTSTGTIMGTVDYMSPEQAMDTKHADARSDIYSLGCSLYYLLTGRVIYDGDTMMKKLMAHRESPIPELADESRRVGRVIETHQELGSVTNGGSRRLDPPYEALDLVFRRMVAKKPEDRPQSMTQVIAELERCLSGGSPTVAFERSGSSRTNTATIAATSGNGNELQDFLRQISGEGEAPSNPMARDSSRTVTMPSHVGAQTIISSADVAGTDSQSLTSVIPTSKPGSRKAPSGNVVKLVMAIVGVVVLIVVGLLLIPSRKPTVTESGDGSPSVATTAKKTTKKSTTKNTAQTPNDQPVGAANDPERSVAKWVISKGGRVDLHPMYQQISRLAELPKEPFVVNAVIFTTLQELTVADVDRLATLSHLRGLSLTDALLTVESARRIADKLSLDGFSYDTITAPPTPPAFQELLKCRSLHALTLKHPAIDDELVSRLGQLDRLTALVLDKCPKVTSGGLIRFAGNPPPKLNVFNMGDVHVDRRMLEAIATLPHLESLSLRGGVYDDLGLAELHRCPALCQFSYAGNSTVTRAGITALQKVLGDCQMNLADPELATALYDQSYRDTVRELMRHGYLIHVRTNKSSGAWLQDEQAFPEGEVLYAANIYPKVRPGKATNEDVKLLTKLRDLPILSIDQLPSNGLRELLPLQNLSSLAVGSPLTEKDAQLLLSFKKLNAVNVHVASDAALESLAQLPHLSILHLMLPVDTKIQSLKPLESVATLSQLHFPLGGGATLTEADAQAFANARPDVIVYWAGKRLDPAVPRAANEPPPAVAPFDAPQARAHQEAWAKHLGVPVEKEVTLPGGEKLVMMLIPPGEFVREDGGKQFPVRITKPFYLGKHEVTQSQWQAVMGNNPSQFPGNPTSPVEQVSWDDLQPFLEKLNAASTQENFVFALPTEAQWEFACRAGTTTKYSFGDSDADLPQHAWFHGNAGGKSHSVGQLTPNPFGLYDVHGNVWEWCADWFLGDYYSKAPLNDPPGPSQGPHRVTRGCGWNNAPPQCDASYRAASGPESGFRHIGFRLAASIDVSKLKVPSALPEQPSAPPPAIAPFDAKQARAHQEAWAKHLGVPVEYTNSIGMKFRLIPPGEFTMGTTQEEINSVLDAEKETLFWAREGIVGEGPQHKVTLTQPVYVGITEVTQKTYEVVVGHNPSQFAKSGSRKEWLATSGLQDTSNLPVEGVSWNDAIDFCSKLNQREARSSEGPAYRLLTEAEWEFSCRAGTTTRCWRGNLDQDVAKSDWCATNSAGRPHPVGELESNPFGLYDVHGNVWEWVQDSWDTGFYGRFVGAPAIDPVSVAASPNRIVRGGDCFGTPMSNRSARRHADASTRRDAFYGFRVALSTEAVRQALKAAPKVGSTFGSSQPPRTAVAPFDATQARAHQDAWAKHLGVPVEKEITLPGGEKLMMMLIPPGEFSRNEENQPSFRVRLTKPFYLGKHEVTQAQWQSVMGNNPSQFKDSPLNPVEQVTWDEIQPFLAKLNSASAREKLIFGLPTEAQWEFACRAGTTGLYSFGNNVADLLQYGHYNANSNGKTHRIGELKPNPFGLHDMHGNLWEWCVDWKLNGYYAKAPLEDPPGPSEGSDRVSRGGSWFFDPQYLQSGMRGMSAPSRREPNSGFRLAASIDVASQSVNAAIPAAIEPPQYALDFNDRLENGNARVVLPKMLRPNEACTVEMHFTARSVSDQKDNRVLFVNANGMQLVQQQMYLDWSGPLLAKQKDNRVRSKDAIKVGQRTHLAGVSAGKELRLFVDGQLVGQMPLINDLPSTASNCYLGSLAVNLDSFNPLDGLIDEVRISKGVRYTDNFKPASRFEADADTLALYHFDEGAGEVLKDSSGNNYHGEIIGAKWVKLSNASPSSAWIDWLGPRLKRNEIGGNGWIREGDAFTTERDISGIRVIPDDLHDGAIRVTYLLRDAKGIQLNARDRKTDNTDATRELYVTEDNGHLLRLSRSRSGEPYKDLITQPIPASIPKDASRTLEFRVVGDTLTATLNGSVVATAKDSTIPVGNFALVALKGVLIQKVEYQSLDEPNDR